MILRNYTVLPILLALTSGCSLLGTKEIEIISKPVEIEIMQPDLPRPVDLTAPNWYVVSEAKIANPCAKQMKLNEKGEHIVKDDGTHETFRPKACAKEDTENPEWPIGYTYLDRFMDEMKEQNNGEIVFVATTIGDYKVMAEDMQELKRYIKQLGEVVIYYRNVTIKDKPAVGAAIEVKKDGDK
jgi:hypothetical protein